MRSPQDMQTIQIDITNACNKACSNCTRFCGNHKKVFFMDFDTFKRAVDSLEGYDGVIGVMGGEPTLHPEFERFSLYLNNKYKNWREKNSDKDISMSISDNRMIYPQKEFIKEIHRREFETHHIRDNSNGSKNFMMSGPGLWSNMGVTYRKNYELIQDLFEVQFLNDHINASYHQPGLFSRKDLGLTDEKWIPLRDNCWIQNEWSATITPKGAFFCEIAGALDMLFDGPGGWKIEPGWWKRKPEDFGDQLHWCEICGFALDTFMRDANDEIDDVSPTLYEMMKNIDSPRMKKGRVNCVEIVDGKIAESSKAAGKHFSVAQPYIEHYEDRFNESNSHLFIDEFDVVDKIDDGERFGQEFNKVLKNSKEWILYLFDEKSKTSAEEYIRNMISTYIINPGTLHLGDGFAFFSKEALSLRKYGYDRIAHSTSFNDIISGWEQSKVMKLSELDVLTKWNREKIVEGKRYVIWGAGFSGAFLSDAVKHSSAELVYSIDVDASKDGKDFYGGLIHQPEYLKEHMNEFDYLIIAHYSRFEEILNEALELGVERERIIMPYEV